MGQIVFNGQKPKYCNIQAIQTGGLHVNDVVSSNEIWLVDTTNSNKVNGIGKYDAYIIGDGTKKAGQLPLHYINPKRLSELESDSMHRTVTDEDITKWNTGTGDGDVVNNPDNEDLTSTEISEGVSVLKLKDKNFDASSFSGLGKVIARKNIVNEVERVFINITPAVGDMEEDPSEDPEETAEKVKGKFYDLQAGVGGTAVEKTYSATGYLKKEVIPGEIFNFKANFVPHLAGSDTFGPGYFWAVIDKTTGEILQCDDVISEQSEPTRNGMVEIEYAGYLIVNILIYQNPLYWIYMTKLLDNTKDVNIPILPNATNTCFVIQYDYDLNGRKLVLPADSTLKFEGGSIKNGFIEGNNTFIEANSTDNIFGRDIHLIGTWKTIRWYANWFGVYSDGITDDTKVLQMMLDLPETIASDEVVLDWYNCTFRTTKGLYIKNNTTLLGGTIKAKFTNPLDWVLQTYSLVGNAKPPSYNGAVDWSISLGVSTKLIKDLTIRGELNDNGDGTWAPIFGGVRLTSTSCTTENLNIRGVGYGMLRTGTVVAIDRNVTSWCYFGSYFVHHVINVTLDTAYFQAHCHYQKWTDPDTSTEPLVPFAKEYQPVIWNDDYSSSTSGFCQIGDSYIDGTGGIDDKDPDHKRPQLCAFKAINATMELHNIATDYTSNVAIALGVNCQVKIDTMRFESINECFIYNRGASTLTLINAIVDNTTSTPTYDIRFGNEWQPIINLIDSPDINCKNYGISTATLHKFYNPGRYNSCEINILGQRNNNYPNLDCFHFLGDNDIPMYLAPKGTEDVYVSEHDSWYNNSGNGKYITVSKLLRADRTNYIIEPNTIIDWNHSGNLLIGRANTIITGSNRNTSVIKVTNSISFSAMAWHNTPIVEFRNLTIDFNGNIIHFYYQQQGGAAKIRFIECNIITSQSGFIYGTEDESVFCDVELIRCNIYSKYQITTRGGNLRIKEVACSPIVRYGRLTTDYNKNINLEFIKQGTTSDKNKITYHLNNGYNFYDLTLSRNEVWNGRQWVSPLGYPYILEKGTTANTPALPNMKVGSLYEDTTLSETYKLTANGTCGYGVFNFNAVFPTVDRAFYVGTTEVTPSEGAFSVNLPAGTYPVSCPGYDCYPSTITISDNSTVAIYQKAKKFTTNYTVTIHAVDGNDNVLTDLVIKVGGYTATVPSGKDYYQVSIPTGEYQVMAEGYTDQTSILVNGRNAEVTAVFTTEVPSTNVVLDGSTYDHDSIYDSNGNTVVAGKYNVAIDSISLEVSLTATDLSTILYFIDDAISDVNKQLDYLLIKKWFEAGHYGEYVNNVGAKLYSDTVGSTTGNAATFTDTSTNLVCTVTHTAGTNATWELVPSGSTSDSSINIVAASGTALTANTNTYYTFATAVNTLAVTLPTMTNVTSVKALCLAFTAGTTPQITFTSADSKTVAYYDTYSIDAECEYEVTCLFNGTKWIVSSALIS